MEELITGILSGVASGRRYWGKAPQSAARPFLVLTRIDGVRDYTFQGPSGYVASRVQIDCYADTYAAVKTAGRATIAALSGYRSGDILGIFVESERDLPAADAGEVNHLFRVSIDVIVHHREA